MKKLALALLSILAFSACQQQKIGFVDNTVLINDYQERKDIEAKLQIKIEAFKMRTANSKIALPNPPLTTPSSIVIMGFRHEANDQYKIG